MKDDLVQRIVNHPAYQELKAKRSSFGGLKCHTYTDAKQASSPWGLHAGG